MLNGIYTTLCDGMLACDDGLVR